MFIRDDMADIRVTVDGTPVGGSWATYEGGVLEAEDAKSRAGGMGREISSGGRASRDDATVTIQMDDEIVGQHKWLEGLTGVGRVTISVTPMTHSRAAGLVSFTLTGTVKSPQLPNWDANGGEVAFYTLVVSCDELAA